MISKNKVFPDRVSVSQSCDNQYCRDQILYTHPIKNHDVSIKIICCEDSPPQVEGMDIFYWDTHHEQVHERLKIIENRKDIFLNLTSNPEETELPYLFDKSSSDYAHLLGKQKIALEQIEEDLNPEMSIIIPTFGHAKELKKVIESLHPQDLPFELIIVATRNEENDLKNAMRSAPKCHLKLITLDFKRQLGDFRYAAGHMRNIGVQYSTTPNLLFMDSDILLPQNSLRTIKESLSEHSIVMPKREHLKGLLYRLLTRATEREKDQHWLNFYSNSSSWSHQNAPWQFVSTYTLGMSKAFFMKLGGFNPSFNSYGFEDVELGYRAYKQRASFKLLDFSVQHIFHHNKRSEYGNNEKTRQEMLARTARIFYDLHRDDEIYKNLKHYLSEPHHV